MYSYYYVIKNNYHYYGAPQSEDHYIIKGDYFNGIVYRFGNQGFDYPKIAHTYKNNGYFWSLNIFMEAFFNKNDILKNMFRKLKEGESIKIEITSDGIIKEVN